MVKAPFDIQKMNWKQSLVTTVSARFSPPAGYHSIAFKAMTGGCGCGLPSQAASFDPESQTIRGSCGSIPLQELYGSGLNLHYIVPNWD